MTTILHDLLAVGARWVSAHLGTIATTFTTALLVIFGDDINRWVKHRVQAYPFLVRTAVFVVLCSFGYGLLTVLITPSVARLINYFGAARAPLVVVGCFVAVGLLAERQRYL